MKNLFKGFKRSMYFLILIFSISLFLPEILPTLDIVQTVTAATIKLNLKKATLIKGDTLDLKITGTKKSIKWSSSNKKVAIVSKTGKVKAIKTGSATITALVDNKKYNCKVTVESPRLNETEIITRIGWTEQLEIEGTSQDITWNSSDENIVSVSDDGLIEGNDIGEATITATIGKHKYNCIVKIPKPYFMYSSLDIGVGEIKWNTLYYKSDDTEYKSNNLNIAIVDKYGNVTGIKEGSTTISVITGGYTYEYPVTVKITTASIIRFLEKNYSTLDTCIGTTKFSFNVYENTSVATEYDYWVMVDFEYSYFSGAMYSIKYTDAQKNQLRQELKDFQEKLANALISAMPYKKFYGGYYKSWYTYPNIKVDLNTLRYYSWINYDKDPMKIETDIYHIYENAKPSYFRWYDFIDDTL